LRLTAKGNVSAISIILLALAGWGALPWFNTSIYNGPRVKDHFGATIWVCVSDFFDKKRIESIHREEFNTSCSLSAIYSGQIDKSGSRCAQNSFCFWCKKKSNTYQLSTSKYLPTIILFHYSSMGYMNVFVITHGFASAGGSG
jgi:hypothetical protein